MNISISDMIEKLRFYEYTEMANQAIEWLKQSEVEPLQGKTYDKVRLIKDLPIHEYFVNKNHVKNFGFKESIKNLNTIADQTIISYEYNTNNFSIILYLTCDTLAVIGLIGIYRNRDMQKEKEQMIKLINKGENRSQ